MASLKAFYQLVVVIFFQSHAAFSKIVTFHSINVYIEGAVAKIISKFHSYLFKFYQFSHQFVLILVS